METVFDCHSASRSSSWKRLLHSTKNQPQRTVKQLLDVTRKLVTDQKEIQGTPTTDFQENSWKRATLLTDRAVRLSTAKAYVFSDSVLCMGRISEHPVKSLKGKIDWFMNSSQCRELYRIDGKPIKFEWKNFPGSTTLQILAEIQNMKSEYNVNLSNSQDGSSSCQCTTTLSGEKKETKTCVFRLPKS